MTMASGPFERVRRAIVSLAIPFEANDAAASFVVHPAPGASAVLDVVALPNGDTILIAELVLLESTMNDWRATLPLSRWSGRHPFIKFCRYDDGRLVARAELLPSRVDRLELAVTLSALYHALALTDEARMRVGGEPAQAAWDPDRAADHLDAVPSVPSDQLLSRLRGYLADADLSFEEQDGAFELMMPSGAQLAVVPSEDGRIVSVRAVVAAGIDPWNVGASQLLHVNGEIGFAALSVDEEDRAVVIKHDLVAATLDQEELSTASHYMAHAIAGFGSYFAQGLDPSIREAVSAAKRFVDALDSTQADKTGDAPGEPK